MSTVREVIAEQLWERDRARLATTHPSIAADCRPWCDVWPQTRAAYLRDAAPIVAALELAAASKVARR